MAIKLFLLLIAVSYVSAISFPEESFDRMTNSPLAVNNQFPYVISLQQITELPNVVQAHRCGGALFTLQHALTIAACVSTTVNSVHQVLPAAQYRVYAGAAQLTADTAERSRNVANFTIHPEYVAYPASLNDIAIITTVQPFLNSTVFPIPLPSENYLPADFTLCNVAGWGAPNTSVTASNDLRYTTKYIYNNDLCTNIWNAQPQSANIFPSMICSASYDIISSGCFGDNGNALVCSGQLTGLLFLTNGCAVSAYPEVYTRVSNYTTWIQSISGAGPMFRPEFSVLSIVAIVCMKMFS